MRDAVHVTKEGGSMRVGEFECGWVDERAGEWVEQAWHDHTQAIRGPYTDHTQAIHGPYSLRPLLTCEWHGGNRVMEKAGSEDRGVEEGR